MRQLTSLDAQFLALETPRQTGHVAGVAILDPSTAPGWSAASASSSSSDARSATLRGRSRQAAKASRNRASSVNDVTQRTAASPAIDIDWPNVKEWSLRTT